jgi:hypothetical protein
MASAVTYVKSHEDVVKLMIISHWTYMSRSSETNLLIANGEFTLGLLIGIGKSLELLDGLALQD